MGIFSLLIAVPLIALYGLLGVICLKVLKIETNIYAILVFIMSGIVAGLVAIVIYGLLVTDQSGQLNGAAEIVGMFAVSGLFALLISVFSVRFINKYNTALKRDRANRAAP